MVALDRRGVQAFKKLDRAWLAGRLDAFIKYELYSSFLAESGRSWEDLKGNNALFSELALLDHSYHEFTNPDSLFTRLEQADALCHRVPDRIVADSAPYVPLTSTRARSRAQFITEHAGRGKYLMDWTSVTNVENGQYRFLHDPFAQEFGPWQRQPDEMSLRRPMPRPDFPISDFYDRGQLDRAYRGLCMREGRILVRDNRWRHPCHLTIWVQTRRGEGDANLRAVLQQLYPDPAHDLQHAIEHIFFHRFCSLWPAQEIDQWLDLGTRLIETHPQSSQRTTFLEHLGAIWLCRGQVAEARGVLQSVVENDDSSRRLARALANLADCCRLAGDVDEARSWLSLADELCTRLSYGLEQADFVCTTRAKLEPDSANEWLGRAREFQMRHGCRVGLARTLLLQARFASSPQVWDDSLAGLKSLYEQSPGLRCDERFAHILEPHNWEQWAGHGQEQGLSATYAGL